MKVLIDADACPVVDIAVSLCRQFKIQCHLLCDTAHEIYRDSTQTHVLDKGADSVDFAIANRVEKNDIVLTQDYGLASMCLACGARVIHQDGWEYTLNNIDALLLQRHASKVYRASGGRTKGPAKRKTAQDQAFAEGFRKILEAMEARDV